MIGVSSPLYAAQEKKSAKAQQTAEDYYKMWLTAYDNGKYKESIQFMKKAIELDPAYSTKINEHINEHEKEIIAKLDIEAKRKELLTKETVKELKDKKLKTEKQGVSAQRKPLKFGPITFNPYVTYRLTWDDNIFLTNDDKRADLISNLMPGVKGEIDLPFDLPFISGGSAAKDGTSQNVDRTLIHAEYIPDIRNYFENPSQNIVGHTVLGATTIPSNLFGGRGKLVFGVKDILRYTADPATSERTAYTPRFHNDLEAKAKYAPNEKISPAVAYRYIIEYYTKGSMEDYRYTEHIVTPTLFYNITPKTSLFLDTDLGKIIYEPGNRNSAFIQVSGGITGQVTQKTNVYFKAGGQIRSYTHDEIYNNYVAFTTKGGLSSQLRKDVLMRITLTKDAVESTYQENAYYDYKHADLELIKSLTGKLSLMTGGSFGISDYPRDSSEDEGIETRKDYMWGLKAGISYSLLPGLDSNITYEFKARDSNFKTYNYQNNKIIGNIRASY